MRIFEEVNKRLIKKPTRPMSDREQDSVISLMEGIISPEQFMAAHNQLSTAQVRHRFYTACSYCSHVIQKKNWDAHRTVHMNRNQTAVSVRIGTIADHPFFGMKAEDEMKQFESPEHY